MTTALVTCFEVGAGKDTLRMRVIGCPEELGQLDDGRAVLRSDLAKARRWTPLLRDVPHREHPEGATPLRSVARVHRGVATGANDFFVLTRAQARQLGLEQWCRPVISSAKEILEAGGIVRDTPQRRLLLDVPADIDRSAFPRLDAYLRVGESGNASEQAVCDRYLPSHRRPWWNLGIHRPPPIVASYMARQAPVFALNPDGLVLLNIAHGVYPHRELNLEQLAAFTQALNSARESFRGSGRTYHGGLEKFEPREMENLPVPAEGLWVT